MLSDSWRDGAEAWRDVEGSKTDSRGGSLSDRTEGFRVSSRVRLDRATGY